MSRVHLERLTLRLSGISAADARRLATLVADRLATDSSLQGERRAERVRLRLESRPGEGLEAMAGRIVAQLAAVTKGA